MIEPMHLVHDSPIEVEGTVPAIAPPIASQHIGVCYVRGAGLYYDRGAGLQRIAGYYACMDDDKRAGYQIGE